jgi:hypothetical protein
MTIHIATATFRDTWAGDINANLIPQRIMRKGERVTVYRWITDRGILCDNCTNGHPADYMVQLAKRNARFSNVVSS